MIPAFVPTITALPPLPARIHFVGIGGIGMSGLARILHAWGYGVSGSDAAPSEQTAMLAALGVAVTIGHTDVAHAAAADLLVVTRASDRAENPEIGAALAAAIPIVKRGELLGLLANARRCVAVAGSHGKSTTSGMIVHALRALGGDPSYAVGAVVGGTGANAEPGGGDAFVVEADEFDHQFLWLRPEVTVVTNVEFDHPDIFPNQASYDAAFAAFVENAAPDGVTILSADDLGCRRLSDRVVNRVLTYGECAADWRLRRHGAAWSVAMPDGRRIAVAPAAPGRHNAHNATAAIAALTALGFDPADAAAALASFAGVGRRFEVKGEAAGVLVVDDYAHHPTEVRATLRAARERYGDRRLWAVFQPHTFSRTKALLADFAAAFADADETMILDIYPSRETDSLGISADDLRIAMPFVPYAAASPDDAVRRLSGLVVHGDVVVTLGAGDVTLVGPALLHALHERSGS